MTLSPKFNDLVELSVQDLLRASAGEQRDSVVFTGVWHDSYPAILVRDPILPDSAKVLLLYLMQEARSNPYGVNPLPSVDQTARDLSKSRTTIVRDHAIIRMVRWGSQCRKVRDNLGRFRGVIYAMHGEPASLADAIALDSEYMELLEKGAAGHFDRIARRVAKAVLAAIDSDIISGRDPLEPVNPVEQRMEALETLKTGGGRFFGALVSSPQEPSSMLKTGGPEVSKPSSKFELGGDPSPNLEIGGPEPSSNLESGYHSGNVHSVDTPRTSQDAGPDIARSPRTCPEVDHGNSVAIPLSANFALDSCHGDGHQELGPSPIDQEFAINRRKIGHFALPFETGSPSSSCSSSTFKRTTTTAASVQEKRDVVAEPLVWPSDLPDLDDNRRRLVQRILTSDTKLPCQLHQPVVDALAAKMRDKADPIRNFGGYVYEICRRAKAGALNAVSTPAPVQGRSPSTERAVRINTLHSEIRALEQLLGSQRTSAGRRPLEAQLAQRRSQLKELEEPVRH